MIRMALTSAAFLMNRFLDSSDWIRYGSLAFFLTMVFYFLLHQQPQIYQSNYGVQTRRESVALAPPSLRTAREPHHQFVPDAHGADARATASRQPQVAAAPAPSDSAPRLAICAGVVASLPDYRAGKLRRNEAFKRALKAYSGPATPGTPRISIAKALIDYNSGVWSEKDCPQADALQKGTIAEVMHAR